MNLKNSGDSTGFEPIMGSNPVESPEFLSHKQVKKTEPKKKKKTEEKMRPSVELTSFW